MHKDAVEEKLISNHNSNNTLKMKSVNVSPLRYPGGKTRACKIIDAVMIEHFDMTCFDTVVSPFFGGGSFEFYLQNKYGLKLIVNDKFTPLYNFWNCAKNNNKEFYKKAHCLFWKQE
jgi:DNA adenine methylase